MTMSSGSPPPPPHRGGRSPRNRPAAHARRRRRPSRTSRRAVAGPARGPCDRPPAAPRRTRGTRASALARDGTGARSSSATTLANDGRDVPRGTAPESSGVRRPRADRLGGSGKGWSGGGISTHQELACAGRQRGRVHRPLAGVHHRAAPRRPRDSARHGSCGTPMTPALPVVLGLGRRRVAGRWKASPEFERGLSRPATSSRARTRAGRELRIEGSCPPLRAVPACAGPGLRGLTRMGCPAPSAGPSGATERAEGTETARTGGRPRGVPHRRSHILDLAGREGGAATPRRPRRPSGTGTRAVSDAPVIISRMPNAVRRIGLGTAFALLAGTLLLGHALKAPCAAGDWSDNRQYTRLCYSDIVHQLATEQLRGNRLPYLDACEVTTPNATEYPVLTMWTMRAAAWVSGPSTTGLLLHERDHALDRRVRHRVLPVPARRRSGPVLRARPHARALRDDELGPARGRARHGRHARRTCVAGTAGRGCSWGLGAAAKVFPMLLVVPFVAGRFRGRRARSWVPARVDRRRDLGGGEPALRAPGAEGLVGVLPLQHGPPRRLGQPVVRRRANAPPARPARTRGWSTWRPWGCSSRWVAVVWVIKARRDPGSRDGRSGFPILVLFLLTEQGLLAAVQPVAAPVVRARLPAAGVVRGVRARGRGGVRHALLVVRPVPRPGRRGRRVAGGRVRARGGGARADPGGVRDRVDPRSARGSGARPRRGSPATAAGPRVSSRHDASEAPGPPPSPPTSDGDNRAVPEPTTACPATGTTSTRTIGIGVVFLLVAGTLAVGFAIKAPCVLHATGTTAVRSRSAATPDLVGLIQSEQLDRRPAPVPGPVPGRSRGQHLRRVPRRHDVDDASVGVGVGDSTTRFFFANAILMWIAALWTALPPVHDGRPARPVLRARAHPRARGDEQLDLLAVAITTAATFAYLRRRDVMVRGAARARRGGQALSGACSSSRSSPAGSAAGNPTGGSTSRGPPRHLDRAEPPVRAVGDDAAGWSSSQQQQVAPAELEQPVERGLQARDRPGVRRTRA